MHTSKYIYMYMYTALSFSPSLLFPLYSSCIVYRIMRLGFNWVL